MRELVKDQAYDVRVNPDNMWVNDRVSKTQFCTNLKEWGYNIPTKPKNRQSTYAIFCKLITSIVKDFFNSESFYRLYGDACDANSSKIVQKIVSPISVYRFLFFVLVEHHYFFQLIEERRINTSYKEFKKLLSDHKTAYLNWFVTNYLTDQSKSELNTNKISTAIVDNTLVNGEINWDESDVKDGILFSLGGRDNVGDNTTVTVEGDGVQYHFEDLLFNNRAVMRYLQVLSDKSDPRYKRAKNALEKFKKRAKDKIKTYFERRKQELFENIDALNTYQQASCGGIQLAPNEQAVQEHLAAENQASPMRQTLKQAGQPGIDEDSDNQNVEGEYPSDVLNTLDSFLE